MCDQADIVDRSLKDLLIRTETNKLVTDLVNLDLVRSLFKMFTVRRRYREERLKQGMFPA